MFLRPSEGGSHDIMIMTTRHDTPHVGHVGRKQEIPAHRQAPAPIRRLPCILFTWQFRRIHLIFESRCCRGLKSYAPAVIGQEGHRAVGLLACVAVDHELFVVRSDRSIRSVEHNARGIEDPGVAGAGEREDDPFSWKGSVDAQSGPSKRQLAERPQSRGPKCCATWRSVALHTYMRTPSFDMDHSSTSQQRSSHEYDDDDNQRTGLHLSPMDGEKCYGARPRGGLGPDQSRHANHGVR